MQRLLTIAEATALQKALNLHGAKLAVDGHFGELSRLAVIRFQHSAGISPESGDPDPVTLAALGIPDLFTPPVKPKGTIMNTVIQNIGANAADYFLNFITSKINWAAATMVALLVTFVSTKFGFTIPPEMAQWLTVEIAAGFGALIVLLRTFFNKPKVVTAVPLVITTKGASK